MTKGADVKAKADRPATGNQLVAQLLKDADPLLRRSLATVAAWRGTTPERYAVGALADAFKETAHDCLSESVMADERLLAQDILAHLEGTAKG